MSLPAVDRDIKGVVNAMKGANNEVGHQTAVQRQDERRVTFKLDGVLIDSSDVSLFYHGDGSEYEISVASVVNGALKIFRITVRGDISDGQTTIDSGHVAFSINDIDEADFADVGVFNVSFEGSVFSAAFECESSLPGKAFNVTEGRVKINLGGLVGTGRVIATVDRKPFTALAVSVDNSAVADRIILRAVSADERTIFLELSKSLDDGSYELPSADLRMLYAEGTEFLGATEGQLTLIHDRATGDISGEFSCGRTGSDAFVITHGRFYGRYRVGSREEVPKTLSVKINGLSFMPRRVNEAVFPELIVVFADDDIRERHIQIDFPAGRVGSIRIPDEAKITYRAGSSSWRATEGLINVAVDTPNNRLTATFSCASDKGDKEGGFRMTEGRFDISLD